VKQSHTTIKFLKILNLLILCTEIFGCIGTFIGYQVVFGHGLGDVFYYAILWVATLVHLIWTVRISRTEIPSVILRPLCIFTVLTTLMMLKATIWRGPEYSWKNGDFFYRLNSKYRKPTKINDDSSNLKIEMDTASDGKK
jgi:hypothetical protein